MRDQNAYHTLDALIEQDRCFAIFRLPEETAPRFIMQTNGAPSLFWNVDDLNGQHGFVIAPFRVTAELPVIVIRPDCTSLPEMNIVIPENQQRKTKPQVYESTDKVRYSILFELFKKPLLNGKMKKLVLSRRKTIDSEEAFSPGRTFFKAVEKYPQSYVYLFHTPESGTWLGSSPEVLLSGAKERWQTVALAGTHYSGNSDVLWDDKNLREQHLVTSYLIKQLSCFNITPGINGPYTVKAGNLAHLRTDLSFCIPDKSKAGTLLNAFHPTPAVSGLPKNEACQFIQDNEGYDRRYYSGFLGMLDTNGETGIYVNLRCMQIEKKSLTLFAGGGLLATSSLDDEWEETEHKLKTMLDILE